MNNTDQEQFNFYSPLSAAKHSSQRPVVYLVDDDSAMLEMMKEFYTQSGYDVQCFSSPQKALNIFSEQIKAQIPLCDLIVSDLQMPEMDGLSFLAKLNDLPKRPPLILLTGHASIETAVEALAKGAFDYITKPVSLAEITVISDRAIKVHRLQDDYRNLQKKLSSSWVLEDIVGKSPQMQKVFDFIRKVAPSTCNVLITGESGTGKEMVARAIHAASNRSKKPFIAINCAAIPEALLESELFGHAKGSFTGASERRRGLFEEANEGTIFLDEIGDMPLALQVKLLRFLQERTLKSVGENNYRNVDVRVIAATHQNLKEAVKEKKFREDLYYRLCVAPIELPALRQRKEDIPLLAELFLGKFSKKMNLKMTGFTRAALAKLLNLSWPGNVRELENTIERAVIFSNGTIIDEQDIHGTDNSSDVEMPTTNLFSKLMSLDKLEKEYIDYVLAKTEHKQERAAEILGINRKTLYRKQQQKYAH